MERYPVWHYFATLLRSASSKRKAFVCLWGCWTQVRNSESQAKNPI